MRNDSCILEERKYSAVELVEIKSIQIQNLNSHPMLIRIQENG